MSRQNQVHICVNVFDTSRCLVDDASPKVGFDQFFHLGSSSCERRSRERVSYSESPMGAGLSVELLRTSSRETSSVF